MLSYPVQDSPWHSAELKIKMRILPATCEKVPMRQNSAMQRLSFHSCHKTRPTEHFYHQTWPTIILLLPLPLTTPQNSYFTKKLATQLVQFGDYLPLSNKIERIPLMHYSKKQLLFPSLLSPPAAAPAGYVSYCSQAPTALYCTAAHSAFLHHWPKQTKNKYEIKIFKTTGRQASPSKPNPFVSSN